MEQLSRTLPLELEEHSKNHYTLKTGIHESIVLTQEEERITLESIVGPLPNFDDREPFFSYLMQANFLGQGTGGGFLGINDKELITFMKISDANVTSIQFKETIEEHLNYLDYWKREIRSDRWQNPVG